MPLLLVGAGSWDSRLSNWLKSAMTDLNHPQEAACSQSAVNTAAGSSLVFADRGQRKLYCIFFFFYTNVHI